MCVFLLFIILVFSVYAESAQDGSEKEIAPGLYYKIKSSIYVWFTKLTQFKDSAPVDNDVDTSKINISKSSIVNDYVVNAGAYEDERAAYSEYWREVNQKRADSISNPIGGEPPFDKTLHCFRNLPNSPCYPLSCGDDICASYEDVTTCALDCGECPEGLVAVRGQCQEADPDICHNHICEEGEDKTCPWDCKIDMLDDGTENIDNSSEESKNKKGITTQRAIEISKKRLASIGEIYVPGKDTGVVEGEDP